MKHVSDFLFECKHQVLKRGLQRDRHVANNKLTIYTYCMDFWKESVLSIANELTTEDVSPERRKTLLISFQNVLIASHVDFDEREGSAWETVNSYLTTQINP